MRRASKAERKAAERAALNQAAAQQEKHDGIRSTRAAESENAERRRIRELVTIMMLGMTFDARLP